MSSNQVAPAPAAKPTAIQIIETEIVDFFKQREQAIANLHAINGAIQGAQQLLAKLKAEVAKAEAEAKKLLAEAETSVETVAREVESKVVSIADAIKKEI